MAHPSLFLFCFSFFFFFVFSSVYSQPLNYVSALTGPGITDWDGDLGVPFYFGSRLYFLEGDVLHQNFGRIPNAIGYCTNPQSCRVDWNEVSGGFPYPFYYLLGQSTVPAGAITLNNVAYIFMMNVVNWGNGAPGSVLANSLGIKGIPPTPFAHTSIIYGDNSKFVNIAPVLSSDGKFVYLFGSGLYRASPIHLARVPPDQIENLNAVTYYSYSNANGPVFSSNYNDANPIINGGVGELSATWNSYKKQYLVSYFDFQSNGASVLRLGNSSNPWGPWDTNVILFDSSRSYSWMQSGWYGPYGGYIIPDNGVASNVLYVTVSLWVPYRVFILNVDLNRIYTDLDALNATISY